MDTKPQRVVIRRRRDGVVVSRTSFAADQTGQLTKIINLPRAVSYSDVPKLVAKAAANIQKAIVGELVLESTINLWAIQNTVFTNAARYFMSAAEYEREDNDTDFPYGRIVQPPRTGKTVIMGHIAAATGVPILILVPTKTLIDQHRQDLKEQLPHVKVGVYYGEEKKVAAHGITLATYGIIQRHAEAGTLPFAIRNAPVIFCDEAHKTMTKKRMMALRGAFHPSAIRMAYTATPDYDEIRSLSVHFPELVHEVTLQEAVTLELLAPLRVWVAELDVSASQIRLRSKDYDEETLGRLMSSAPFFAACEKLRYHYEDERGANRDLPALICCKTTQQAYDLKRYLVEHRPEGTPEPQLIIGATDNRKEILDNFKAGKIDTLINVHVLIEGWNSPRCKLEIDLDPSCSMVRSKQKFFRPMTRFGEVEARIFMILPTDLPVMPIFPIDLFGRTIEHYVVEDIHSPKGIVVSSSPSKLRRRGYIASAKAKFTFRFAGEYVDPLLDPHADLQIRRVIDDTFDFTDRPPEFHHFKRRVINHKLFKGYGEQFLRFCGVPVSQMGYYQFMDRICPELAANRFLRRHQMDVLDVPIAYDIALMLGYSPEEANGDDSSHEKWRKKSRRRGYPLGHRALFGPTEQEKWPDEIYDEVELERVMREQLATLTPRQERFLQYRFGIDEWELSLEETGQVFGVTRERVRQVEASALRKMRHPSRTKYLRPFTS